MSGMRYNSGNERFDRRGFTIVELLVVLFIVVIAAGLVTPVVGGMVRSSALRAGTSQIASAIRRTRNMAIMSGEIYCFRFIPRPSLDDPQEVAMYRVEAPVTSPIPAMITGDDGTLYRYWPDERLDATMSPAQVEEALRYPPFSAGGATLPREVELGFDLTQQLLMFLPDGSAWREGLLPPLQITVMLSENLTQSDTPSDNTTRERQIISISSLSGRIAVSDRKDKNH